jgi:hypothetical protein
MSDAHLKLLRHANVGWNECEFGAPSIDCKRPYGSSSPYKDMFDVVYGKPVGKVSVGGKEYAIDVDDWEMPDDVTDELAKLHHELETALQIVLVTGQFKPGLYVAEGYNDWKLVGALDG